MTDLSPLTLLIGVNAANVSTIETLRPHTRARDVLVVEEGHVKDSEWDGAQVYEMVVRLGASFPRNRIFLVARPHHLPVYVPPQVSCVLIDHEASSYDGRDVWSDPGEWSWDFDWQLGAVAHLRRLQPYAGLISPPPLESLRVNGVWNWSRLGYEMAWHNVMCQRAAQVSVARWNDRAAFLAAQHAGNTAALSMQITMKPDAPRYTPPDRVIACCGERGARINGVPNVLLFGGTPEDLATVLTGLRKAYQYNRVSSC